MDLASLAGELARQLRPGDRVMLEGPMGAGKSTFARELLRALGVSDRQAGSPTFAIAHEYAGGSAPVIHIDLYRIRSEEELEDAGIAAYFWERPEAILLVEWLSQFPGFESEVLRPTARGESCWRVELRFTDSPDFREIAFKRLS